MTERESFEQLIERVRAGDDQAASDLVRLYEPEVRRFIHFRLTTPALRRFVDSLDWHTLDSLPLRDAKSAIAALSVLAARRAQCSDFSGRPPNAARISA